MKKLLLLAVFACLYNIANAQFNIQYTPVYPNSNRAGSTYQPPQIDAPITYTPYYRGEQVQESTDRHRVIAYKISNDGSWIKIPIVVTTTTTFYPLSGASSTTALVTSYYTRNAFGNGWNSCSSSVMSCRSYGDEIEQMFMYKADLSIGIVYFDF